MNVRQSAERFIDALHTLEKGSPAEVDQLAALFAPDATIINAVLRLEHHQLSGTDGVRQFWHEYRQTFGTVYSEFSHLTTSDMAAGLFWTTTGSGADGQEIEYHGATLLQFNAAGLITSLHGYYDTRELEQAAGR